MSKIDARAVYLYSRNPQENGFPQSLNHELNYSFCFYDAVEVKQVVYKNEPALLAAYKTSLADMASPARTPFPYQQVLFAFRDIEEGDLSSPVSVSGIETFWGCTDYPLLFISLINLNNNKNIDSVLARIGEVFEKKRCLTYLTFDHCDILLFFRGDSFREFSDNIFKLNYGSNLVNDTITLFTFANERKFPLERLKQKTDETFGVHIRIGVKQYEGSKAFIAKVEALDNIPESDESSENKLQLRSYRLLGRNDIALYHPAASLAWLAELKEIINAEKDFWYTTYDLAVLVPYDKAESFAFCPGDPSFGLEVAETTLIGSSIEIKMDRLYSEFEVAYRNKCEEILLDPDDVWLRWLKCASNLAVTFFKSRLSVDLGTCLVPQFFGLLQYGTQLFKSKKLQIGHMDRIREIFTEVFVNISILVDSLNHSNRQFIQVPSYSSISFEMPPKLMAYFTALSHRLAQVLQDRPYLYSITISPKFACELDVSSFAVHNVLSKHEIITISLEERSIYTLQLTTEALAHEISHFVGDDNRCRDLRRECIIKCALAELIDDLVCDVQGELLSTRENSEDLLIGYDWETLDENVETLWNLWDSLDISPKSKRDDYLWEVYNDILNLPKHLDEQPSLRYALFDALNGIFQPENSDPSGGDVFWLAMARKVSWKVGAELPEDQDFSELEKKDIWKYYRSFISDEIYHVMRKLLSRYVAQNQQDAYNVDSSLFHLHAGSRAAHIRYLFSETFADLQAILLFNMTWDDYCNLLIEKGLGDAAPRMLAVAKTLKDARSEVWPEEWPKDWPAMHSWEHETIQLPPDFEEFSEFLNIEKAITLDPKVNGDSLQELGFSPNLIYYLTKYLKECAKVIRYNLLSNEKRGLVKELLIVHQNLTANVSIYNLNATLMEFISSYHKGLGQVENQSAVQ